MATLERLRGALADVEDIDRMIVSELASASAKTQREQILSDHRVASYLAASQERARTCLEIYKDEDGVHQAELAAMTGPDALNAFYDALKESKAYHRRFQQAGGAVVLAGRWCGTARGNVRLRMRCGGVGWRVGECVGVVSLCLRFSAHSRCVRACMLRVP
jgi:hypothetical protein